MKRTVLSIALVGAAVATFAQKQVGHARHMHPAVTLDASRATDTLYSPTIFDNPALYGVQDQGPYSYIFGTNGYGDEAKCRYFFLDYPTQIEGLFFWMGGKFQGSGDTITSHIMARIYAADGPGENTSGAVTTAPGTVLASVDIPIGEVDTAGEWTIGNLPSQLYVPYDFYAGFDVTMLLPGDSVGCVSSTDQEVEYPEFTWEKWAAPDGWFSLPAAGWGGGTYDADLAVFVVVDNSTIGINELGSINGIQFSILGENPAVNEVNVGYTVDHTANLTLRLLDAKGRQVITQNMGKQSAGEYRHTFDVSALASGTYYVAISEGGRGITKKVNVQR